jgi:hypothetical protein
MVSVLASLFQLFLAWALSLSKKYFSSLLAAIVALLLMVSFLFQVTVVSSEAPTYSRVASYEIGFWLWVASAVTQVVGSFVAARPTAVNASGENTV